MFYKTRWEDIVSDLEASGRFYESKLATTIRIQLLTDPMIQDEQQGLMSSSFVLGILSGRTMQGALVGS